MKKTLFYLILLVQTNLLSAQSPCSVSVSSPQGATCGFCNGIIEVVFAGGTPPYTVNYNGLSYGSVTGAPLQITNACAGLYTISVSDGNNNVCSGMLNGIVTGDSSAPMVLQFIQNDPTCPTCNDGSIQAQVFGGAPPYSFVWSNGDSSSTISNLQQGVYFCYVFDAFGCFAFDTVFLGSTLNTLAYMSGQVYIDNDGNQFFSQGDAAVPYQQIQCLPSGNITYTNQQGVYYFPETPGNYTINYVANPFYSVGSGPGSYNATLGTTSLNGFDFRLQVDSVIHGLQVTTYSPLPRCNSISNFYTTLLNVGTGIDSGEVIFNFDPAMTFVASQPPATVTGNALIFDYSSLLPGQSMTFTSQFLLPGAGTILQLQTTALSQDITGAVLVSDTMQQQITVLCSFDPNDKGVSPEGDGASHRVDMDNELSYLIRFQNTGNDTAFNVLITDTLAAGIDAGSVQMIESSHPCWMQRINGNILRFYFTNIQLPDSNVNEPGSHGYVLFTCKGNSNNPDPTVVYNSANIYFDANAPVITNSTMTTFSDVTAGITMPDDVMVLSLSVSPQPFRDQCVVTIQNHNGAGNHLFRIIDMYGKTSLAHGYFSGNTVTIQRNGLGSGIYLLDVIEQSGSRRGVCRLVVE